MSTSTRRTAADVSSADVHGDGMTGILAGEDVVGLIVTSLGAGLLLGSFYDVFRIRRYAHREMIDGNHESGCRAVIGNITVFAEDILFSFTAAVVFCVVFYRFSWGAVRWYALCAAALSFGAYRVTVGRLVMSMAHRIIGFIRTVSALIRRAVLRIAGALMRAVVRPLSRMVRSAYETAMLPVYVRRSERMKVRILDAVRHGKTEQKQRSRWIKPRANPKHRPTKDG